jgi:hypothetical protein
MYSLEKVKQISLKNNCVCISDIYIDVSKPLKFKCLKCEKEWLRSFDKAHNSNRWCTNCKRERHLKEKSYKKIFKFQKIAESYNLQLLSEEYLSCQGKLTWKCKNNHTFQRSFAKNKSLEFRCPKCYVDPNKLNINYCHEAAKKLEGKCLSTLYVDVYYRYSWQCKKGHIFKASYSNVKKGHWCPKCLYKTQEKVRAIFEDIYKVRFDTATFPWLKNNVTSKHLEIDGYNGELSIAFEYDGEYHFKPHFKNKKYDLNMRKHCDQIKDKLCKEHGILLIRISYKHKSNLKEFIIQQLLEYGVYPYNVT